MAYGTLAGLDAAHGLYTSFFPGLLYFFLGTSRHNSLGVFAVISMMVSSVRFRFVPEEIDYGLQMNYTNTTGGDSGAIVLPTSRVSPEAVVATLTFATGVFSASLRIIFAIVKVGFLSVLISDQVSAGFTTAAGVHVLSAQLDKLFGVKISRHSGPGKLVLIVVDIFRELKNAHLPSVLMSLAAFILLCFIKEVLNPYCAKRFMKGIPIPGDMILVVIHFSKPAMLIILGTLLSHFLKLQSYGMDIVGHIPSGIPSPALPDFSLFVPILVDALTICIVCYCVSISLAQIFAKKFHYEVDSDQEFFALGVCQFVSSFFGCIPTCAAMGRTMVLVSSGGRSQFSSLIASIIVLLVIYWIGPLLESLPEVWKEIYFSFLHGVFLECIIVFVICGGLQKKTSYVILRFTRLLPIDILCYLLGNMDGHFSRNCFTGHYVWSGCWRLLCIPLLRTWFYGVLKKLSVLGAIPQTDLYCDRDSYEELSSVDGIIIVTWKAPLFYGNAKCFETQVLKELNRSWSTVRADCFVVQISGVTLQPKPKGEKVNAAPASNGQPKSEDVAETESRLPFLILDFSKVSAVDTSGMHSIGQQSVFQIVELAGNYGATCYIACCAASVIASLPMDRWRRTAVSSLKTYIPIFRWLSNYDWRKDFVSDVICGLIVGIMQVPQGCPSNVLSISKSMAYAMLAGLHPVHGLYTSFFANLLYCAFGTSHHISFGTFAIISIMTSSVHINGVSLISPNFNSTSDQELSARGEVASALTFLVGTIQLSFGLLRLGCLAQYFSDPLISGFTCGAAVHILCSQLFTVIGVEMIHYKVPWKLFAHIRDLVFNLPNCNIATLVSSIVAITTLSVMKCFDKFIIRPFCGYPFPSELLLVYSVLFCKYMLLVSIPVFRFTSLSSHYGIKLVRPVPSGYHEDRTMRAISTMFRIPSPEPPHFHIFASIFSDALCIAVVSFSLSVSMGKLFAKKYHYVIDADQEWRAYGIVHLVSSLFSCQVSSASLTRSLVLSESGGQTQLSSALYFFVVHFSRISRRSVYFGNSLRGYYYTCSFKFILASIVIVALRGSAAQFKQLPVLWKTSKSDLAVWLVSFYAAVILDALWGLILGVLFSLALLNRQLQRYLEDHTVCIHRLDSTVKAFMFRYSQEHRCEQSGILLPVARNNVLGGLRICTIQYGGPVCFLTAEGFRDFVVNAYGLPGHEISTTSLKRAGNSLEALLEQEYTSEAGHKTVAIIDGSKIAFMDASGADVFRQTLNDLEAVGVTVILASFTEKTAKFLKKYGVPETGDSICVPIESAMEIAKKMQQ
ncbi:Sulfate tra GLY and STAS and Sulfate transp domai n containing protein [Trichuris trichiura]|uniref:Sulfate tra GLY and STAS and Sulfate transp domai n containing protein n=1 Tax=Trichuris trichiura TaxID=36087 RepID=A0A077YVP6_TRITR|nr:Sulfate tra GLY and STAS and Sulfate transp domai n containing protein [Trichuris trichiura]